MATNQNARDLLLQATVPRILPYTIPIDMVEGLPGALGSLLKIIPSGNAFTRTGSGSATTPTTITLTAEIPSAIPAGNVVWTVLAGSGSFTTGGTRNSICTVNGSSVTGYSITIQASVGGKVAQYTISKFGALSAADTVNLATQVTNSLSAGNVTGLGALALLNTVNLNTQTVGALNGLTQVNNLGVLAYANALAADQIGAGTLAAGVIYAGSINANNINAGTMTGRTVRTAASGARAELGPIASGSTSPNIIIYNSSNQVQVRLAPQDGTSSVFAQAESSRLAFQGEGSSNTAGFPVAQFRNTGTQSAMTALNTSAGTTGRAAIASATNGIGLEAGGGFLDVFFSGSGFSQMRTVTGILPARAAGTFCMHAVHGFCFSIGGSSWVKNTGWVAV